MGTHFVLSGMGLSDIAYFSFCIVAEVKKWHIFNQSIYYQDDRTKINGYLEISCSWFIFMVRTRQVRDIFRVVQRARCARLCALRLHLIVAQKFPLRSPFADNYGFRTEKKSPLRSIFYRNFAKPQRVSGHCN